MPGVQSKRGPVQGSRSPSFDVAILDSEEFTRGILQPIKPATLEYYWQQRWPQDLLLYLFIHKVEDLTSGSVFVNSPNDQRFGAFQSWVDSVQGQGIVVGTKTVGRPIGPPLSEVDVSDLKKLVEAEKEGLRLIQIPPPKKPNENEQETEGQAETEKKYQLCRVVSVAGFCLQQCKSPAIEEQCVSAPIESKLSLETTPTEVQLPLILESVPVNKTGDGSQSVKYGIHLRSVQGILYYLGEVLRSAEVDKKIVKIKIRKERKETSLFILSSERDKEDGKAPLSVKYEGQVYEAKEDMAKNALTIAGQLLGLHRKSKELPTTQAVQFVGQ